MKRVRAHGVLVGLALAPIGACSLILDDIDVTCMDSRTDCAAFNEKYGRDAGPEGDCFIYQCRADHKGCEQRARDLDGDGFADEKTCAKQVEGALDCHDEDDAGYPDGGEICDQADNDCDGLIDEGALNQDALEAPLPIALDFSGIARVSHTLDASGKLVVALTNHLNDAATTRIASRGDMFKPVVLPDEGRNFWDLALVASKPVWFALGLDKNGCAAGQLRIGVSNSLFSEPTQSWNGVCDACDRQGLKPMSLSSAGLDVSGNCTESGPTIGASAPALAILNDDRGKPSGGLALWRAGAERAGAQLPLVGLPLRVVASKGDRDLIVAVEGAWPSSKPFDEASAGSEAAIIQPWLSARTSGYFVAYDSEDGVELAFVPAAPTSRSADFAAVARLPIASRGARHLAMALSEPEQGTQGTRVALAWLAQVAGGETVMLARVAHDPAADPPFELISCAALLDDARAELDGPGLIYARDGFAVTPRPSAGGLVISWVERGGSGKQLFAARLPDDSTQPTRACQGRLEGSLLESPFVLADEPSIEHLFMFSDAAAELGFGFVTKAGGQRLNIGELRCREPRDVMQGVRARK